MTEEWLTKEMTVCRDENGELCSEIVEVEGLGNKKIKVIPIPRGKLLRLQKSTDKDGNTNKNQDEALILEHCLQPKFKAEDFVDMSIKMTNSIVFAILSVSTGISQSKLSTGTFGAAVNELEKYQEKKP